VDIPGTVDSLDHLDIQGTPDQVATVDSLVLPGTVDSPDTQEVVFRDIQDSPDTAASPGLQGTPVSRGSPGFQGPPGIPDIVDSVGIRGRV